MLSNTENPNLSIHEIIMRVMFRSALIIASVKYEMLNTFVQEKLAELKEPDICEFENMILEQLQQFIRNIGRFETL